MNHTAHSKIVLNPMFQAKCDLYMESAHGHYNGTDGLEAFPQVQDYIDCMKPVRVTTDNGSITHLLTIKIFIASLGKQFLVIEKLVC